MVPARWCLVLGSLWVATNGAGMWQDQTDEFLHRCVPAPDLPKGLQGSLYFAGPSLWSLGDQELRHSFDGLGRLHRLYFDVMPDTTARLCHSARFIASAGTKAVLQKCDLTSAAIFQTAKGGAWWTRLPGVALLAANLDNTWVNSLHFAGRLELMTDTPEVVMAKADNLEVYGAVQWNDTAVKTWMPAVLSTAHPIVHPKSGEAYNVLLDTGVINNEVVLYKRSPLTPEIRQEVARVPVGSNMLVQHSWALAKDFAVVFAHPMFADPVKGGDMVSSLVEQPSKQNFTRLLVVPLGASNGAVKEVRGPPFILVHAVNAYLDGDKRLVMDVEGRPALEGESFYGQFTLDRVRDTEAGRLYYKQHFEARQYGIYRFEVSLAGVSITDDVAALVKLDLCSSEGPLRWHLPGYRVVAEAQFVPETSAADAAEDSGWLLAPVQEVRGSQGALAVVNASSMQMVSLTQLQAGDTFNWCAHSTYVEGIEGSRLPAAETPLSGVKDAVERCKGTGRGAEL